MGFGEEQAFQNGLMVGSLVANGSADADVNSKGADWIRCTRSCRKFRVVFLIEPSLSGWNIRIFKCIGDEKVFQAPVNDVKLGLINKAY